MSCVRPVTYNKAIPMNAPDKDITLMLHRLSDGDEDVVGSLMPLVYDELHAMADRQMRRERANHTLNSTALVHEAYLRLSKESDGPQWANQKQFFSAAAEAMRRILIDRIRTKNQQKRGPEYQRVDLDEVDIALPASVERLLAIDAALDELAKSYPDSAEVVKLRFFVGFTSEEIAEHTGASVSTVTRQWAFARAWLAKHMPPTL